MNRIIWAGQALEDLADVDDVYAALEPDHADRIGRAAVRAARSLVENPYAGPLVKNGRRKWRLPGTRYLIASRVVAQGVEIPRVRHGRENWRAS